MLALARIPGRVLKGWGALESLSLLTEVIMEAIIGGGAALSQRARVCVCVCAMPITVLMWQLGYQLWYISLYRRERSTRGGGYSGVPDRS